MEVAAFRVVGPGGKVGGAGIGRPSGGGPSGCAAEGF